MRNLSSYLLAFFFTGLNLIYSQDVDRVSISQINGNATPPGGPPAAVALANTCPNATYELTITLENTSGGAINTTVNLNVVVNGPNQAANGGVGGTDLLAQAINLGAGGTADYVFTLDLSDPGANSLTVDISGVAIAGESGTGLNNNTALANITSNAIPATATLNSDVGTTICEGDLVTISSGGGSSYHFFINGAPLTALPTTDSSFNTTSLADGDVVTVTVVDASGCITDNTLTFTVNQSPNSEGGGVLVDLNPALASDGFVTTELQKDRITITGSSAAAGEKYFANVNGTLIEYETSGVETNNTIATQLADLIDDLAFINTANVTTVGATSEIEITGLNPGADYTMEVSSSVTANATIGIQRLQAAKTITICESASEIDATGSATVASWAFTLNGAPPPFAGFAAPGGADNTATLTAPPNNSLLRVLGTNADGCSSEKYVNIIVNEVTSPGVIAADQTICIGDEPDPITSTAAGSASSADAVISYSWYFNNGGGWTEFDPPVTTEDIEPDGLVVSTDFRRRTISTLNGMTCTDDSNVITITVEAALNAGQARDQATTNTTIAVCFNSDADILEVNGGEADALDIEFDWEWSYNNADWTSLGVDAETLDPTVALTQDIYYRRVTKRLAGGLPICEVNSAPVLVRVNTINPGTIDNAITLCLGDDEIIQSLTAAIGAGGDGTITYQWEAWNGAAWVDANTLYAGGDTLVNYNPGAADLTAGTHRFRRGARSTYLGVACPSGATFEYSNEVTITVEAALNAGAVQAAGAAGTVICSGENAPELEDDGTGEAAAVGIEFLWQTSLNDVDWNDAGVTTASWDPADALVQDTYYRRVTRRMDGLTELCRVESASLLIEVNNVTAGAIEVAGGTDETICYNTAPSDIVVDVLATGDRALDYEWYRSERNAADTNWGAFAQVAAWDGNATLSSALIGNLTVSSRYYRRTISDPGGDECTADSNIVTIAVAPEIATPAVIAPASKTVCYGDSPGTLQYTGVDAGAGTMNVLGGINYNFTNQWMESAVTGGPYVNVGGATGTTYRPPAMTSDTFYILRTTLTDENGVVCTSDSPEYDVTVNALPTAPTAVADNGTITNQAQVSRITVGGAPAATEIYYATVDGTLYQYQVLATATLPSNIATGLAAAIDANANVSAVANGVGGAGTIEITADNAGVPFVLTTSVSTGAGGNLGSELIDGHLLLTLCSGDLAGTDLTPTAVGADTYTYFLNGVNQGAAAATYTIPAGIPASTLITIQAELAADGCPVEFGVNVLVNEPNAGSIGSDQTICAGEDPVALTSIVSGSGPAAAVITYQWWEDEDNDGAYVQVGGAAGTAETFDPNNNLAAPRARYYRQTISTVNGESCTVNSNIITIIVEVALNAGAVRANGGAATIICSGETAPLLEDDTTGEAAAAGIEFLWQTSLNDVVWNDARVTTADWNPADVLAQDTYYRRVTRRMDGLTELCRVESASLLIEVNNVTAGAIGVAGGTDETICYNTAPSDIVVDVLATGDRALDYEWYRSERNAADTNWGAFAQVAAWDGNATLSSALIGNLTVSSRYYRRTISDPGGDECTADSNIVTIAVAPEIATPAVIAPASKTVCYGDSPGTLQYTGVDVGAGIMNVLGGINYNFTNQWMESAVTGGPYVNVGGATGTTYRPPAMTSDTFYILRTTLTDENGVVCTSDSPEYDVTVNALPTAPTAVADNGTITNQAQVSRITVGGAPAATEIYYATVDGTIYQYPAVALDGVSQVATGLANEIDANPNVSAVANGVGGAGTIEITADNAGVPFVLTTSVSTGAGGNLGSELIDGHLLLTLCSGDLARTDLTPTAVGADTYTYFLNGANQGAGPTYTIPAGIPASTLITIEAELAADGCPVEFGVSVQVNEPDGGSIGSAQTICSGQDPAAFTSIASGTGPAGATITYYWYIDDDTDGTFTVIPGGPHPEALDYDGNLTANADFYRETRSDLNGEVCTDNSNTIRITVEAALAAGAVQAAGAAGTVICSGENAPELEDDGTGEAAAVGIEFLWQTSLNDVDWNDAGVTTASWDPADALVQDTYYRRVTRRMDGLTELCRVESASLLIEVNNVTAGAIEVAGGTDETICYNTAPSDIVVDVLATGDRALDYEWYRSERNAADTNWGAFAQVAAWDGNATLSSALIGNLTVSSRYYRRTISDPGGDECTADSNIVTIAVAPEIADPTAVDNAITICYGESPGTLQYIGVDVGAGTMNVLGGINYNFTNQWMESPVSGGPYIAVGGATGTTYRPPALTSTTYYILRTTLTDENGVVCTSDTSDEIAITVNALPTAPTAAADNGTITNQEQVSRITVGGAPAAGEIYYATIDGTLYQYPAVALDGVSQVATGLANEIDANPNVSAVANGVGGAGTIEITADNAGVPFVLTTSVSTGAGGNLGSELIDGHLLLTLCSGDLVGTTITASAVGVDTFEFFIDGADQNNGGGAAFVTPAGFPSTALVQIQAWLAADNCIIEYGINIIENEVDGGNIGSSQDICTPGDPAAFTNNVSGTGPAGAIITYYWYIDDNTDGTFTVLPGGPHGETIDYGILAADADFYRETRSDLNGEVCTANSNTINITVGPALNGGTIVNADQLLCDADNNPDQITIAGATADGARIRYQWQNSTVSDAGPWGDIGGATTIAFDPPDNLTQSTWYRRELIYVDAANVELCSEFSDEHLIEILEVSPGTIGNAQTICIGDEPATITNVVGATANTGAAGTPAVVTYQWQQRTAGDIDWVNVVDRGDGLNDGTNPTYRPAALAVNTSYRRLAYGTIGATTCPSGTGLVGDTDPVSSSNIILISMAGNVGTPQYIYIDYAGANTGNTQSNPEIIIRDGGKTYNNDFCGDPDGIIIDFDPCPVSGADSYEWRISDLAAGTIDNDGVPTWTPGYSGTFDIEVRAIGCNGPSGWATFEFTVSENTDIATNPSPPDVLAEQQVDIVRIFGDPEDNEYYSIFIDGKEYRYESADADSSSDVATALEGLITADGDAIVTAVANANQITLTSILYGFQNTGNTYPVGRSFLTEVDFEEIAFDDGVVEGNMAVGVTNQTSENVCGTLVGAAPICQITDDTPNTQFFSDASAFQYVEYDLESFPDAASPEPIAGVINVNTGEVDWNTGFYGRYNVRVRAFGCDGNFSPWQSQSYDINPGVDDPDFITDTVANPIPTCPPDAGDQTQLVSSANVFWSWDNRDAGTLDFNTGMITWNEDFEGTLIVTATSTECGAPSTSRVIYIRSAPSIVLTSAVNSDLTQEICNTAPALTDITYNILGTATGANVTGLPDGVNGTYATTQQIDEVTIAAIADNAVYNIAINGVIYDYTVGVGEVLAAFRNRIVAALDPLYANITITAGAGDGDITLTGINPGEFFHTFVQKVSGAGTIVTTNSQGTGTYTISGAPTEQLAARTRYDFTITTGGSTCDQATQTGILFVNPSDQISLTSAAGTQNQDICNGDTTTEVTYKILGATGASIPALTNFEGLPPGLTPALNTSFALDNQSETVTITSAGAGDELKITINGTEFTSGVLGALEDEGDAGDNLEADITADAAINALVTVTNDGAGGLIITAQNPGVPFSITTELSTDNGNGASITKENTAGTAEFTITSGVVNMTETSITRYTYTITTNGNLAGCTPAAQISGTFTIFPQEAITRNPAADDDGVVGPDFPGTNIQTVCPSDDIIGIRYDITGSIDANSVAVANLPSGVIRTPVTAIQQHTLTITTAETDDVYRVIIDGVSYTYTVLAGNVVNDVALDLADQINNDADARVTVAAVGAGADLVITADTAGVPFTVYAQDALQTDAGGAQIPTITEVVDQVNVNYITITGDPDAGAVLGKTYSFTLTTPGITCTDDSLSGSITVSAGPSIVRTSAAATLNQELCVSTVDNVSSLTPITFKVLGASGYDIPALVDATFTGLPTGITSVGAPTNQVEIVTIAAGAVGDEFKIAINGIEKTSGVLAGAETEVDAANTLEAEITGDAVLGPLVTIINDGAGELTITARDQATPFTISVEANGVAGTIAVENSVGTYAITIQGDPTVVDPNNVAGPLSITTYNYTISTTGNGGCAAFEFSDTITIIPSETITRNGIADDDADGNPDFPGANTQIICPGDTLEGIRYDITGSIDANSVAVANLPSGVIRTPVTAIQQHTLTITTAETDDVYRVIIDGVSYTYTVLAGNVVNDVALDLADQINNDADARVTVAAVGAGADLVITADTAGVPFTVYAQDALQTDAGGAQIPTITEVVDQVNVNYITITGDPDAGAVLGKTYSFTLTTPGITCTDDSLSGSITVSAGPSIVRTSAAATLNQELCVSTVDNVSSLTPITFKVLGASGYDIPALVDATFTGLPTGITSVGAPTNQVEIVTIAAGAVGDEFKIAINGIEKTSGVLAGAETEVDAANTLEAEITGDAVLGPLVTIINDGAGELTITARDQATPFTISVEANGVAGTIAVENSVGTYAITIQGDPTVVDPNNVAGPLSITTYNYTISTTGNGGCAVFEFSDTITIIPSETITRNGIADDDADGNPDFPGANTQIICPGDTLEGIRYDITGSIDANSVAVANLPSGVIRTPVTAIQQHTLTITTAETDDVYRVIIDGVSYTYTVLAGNVVNDVALDLADQINNDADARVTVAAVGAGADLVITADTAGVPFTVYAQDALQTDAGGAQIPTITEVVDQVNVNYITITGDPDAGAVLGKTYSFTLTTPGITCTDDSLSGSITVSAGPSIVRTSAAATLNQELCVSTVDNVSSLTPITFKVLGASGYDIPALVDATFTGLPTGITSVGAPTNQVEIVTIAAGAVGDEFKIAINGIEKTSGVLAGAETEVDAANTLEAEITGDAVLGPLVTIINDGAGELTITARDQATPFTISVEANGVAGTIAVENSVGTYAITIQGDPTVVDPNNVAGPLSITTYNYTISTTGNGGCAVFEFSDTITIIPSETITRNGIADDDADGNPDFPGATNQSLCYNEDLEGIRFDLSGGAYDANSPTAVPPALIGLPPGLTLGAVKQIQQHTLTINTAEADDVYRVIIDGVSYTYTVLAGDAVNDVALDLADQINNDANARVTLAAVGAGADLVITADTAGVPFTVYAQDALQTDAGGAQIPTITEVVNQVNVNYITITGRSNEIITADKTYSYTITSNGTSCVDATLDGVITINPVTEIVLNSAASTLNQQICVNSVPPDNFDNIIFDVTGGAAGISISHTRTDPFGTVTGPFVGMPLNLPDNILNAAGDQIIISGQPNDAALTETTIFTITVSTTLNINGCDEASTSFNIVASPGIEITEPVDINDWKTKNVSCFGLADGAINIPSAAISGGIEATAKEVRLDIGGAPVETDALLVTLNGTTYTYTIRDVDGRIGEGGAVESNSSIANGLAALINNDLNLNITATVDFYGAGTIRLLADVAGTDFTHAIAVGAGDPVTLDDDVVQVNSNVSYVYRWTRNGAAYPAGNGLLSLDNLDPGDYQLTVSINDTTTCAATVTPITITQPNDVTVTITSDCAGAHTASIGAGTGIANQNYIYDIVDENGNDIPALQFGPTTANSYSFNVNPGADYIAKVTVITDNGVAGDDCTYLSNIFTAWNSLVLDDTDVVVTDEQCLKSDNGSIVTSGGNLSINGGSGAYNYSWSGPGGYTSTDQDIYDLSPGDYTVTVTDQNNANCSEITSFTINPATQIIIDPNANNTQQLFCPVVNPNVIGADWGTLEIAVTGGSGNYNITWKKMPSGVIVTTTENNDKTLRINTPGLYVVEVADANTLDDCIVSTDFNITGSVVPLSATIALDDPDQLQGNNVVFTNTGCNGSEIPIEINFQGGNGSYEYNISSGTSSGTWTATASGTSRAIENLNAGEYVIQVRDIGRCAPVSLSATSSGTTIVNRVIVNDVSTDELAVDKGQTNIIDIECSSNVLGFVEISIEGGLPPYRVVWEGPQTNERHSDINGTTDSLANITLPGDYTATVYDSSDCGEPVIEVFTVEDGSEGSLGKPEVTATIQSCGSDQLPEATVVLEKSDNVEIYWETLGNITTKNNQVNEIVILNPVAGDVYTVSIDGTSFNYSSTTSQTNLDVLIGLEAVIASASVSTTIVSSTIEDQNKLVITAVELGREIQVQASAVLSSGSFGFISNSLITLAIESRSGYTKIPGSDGANTIYDLTPGYYHAVVTEESSCVTWITDDIYITSGEFELVNTGLVYSSTCSDQNQTVSADYKFTLLGGSSESIEIELNGTDITDSNNLVSNGSRFIIKNLTEGEYNLSVSDSSSPTIICPVNRTFEITPNIQIGFTDEGYLSDPIEIPLCESYVDFTLNESLVTGGTPFFNSAGIDYYSYLWITPDGTRILNKTSFRAVPGVYELRIEDSNGCSNNLLEPILVEFTYPHQDIELSPGLIDQDGNEVYSLPVGCEILASDGRISVNITGGAPDLDINWYELNLSSVVSNTEIIEWQGLQDIVNAPTGTYKMVLSASQGNQSYCSGNNIGYNYAELVVTVEDDKSLVIQDGPFVSDELCSGKAGTLIIDVLDSQGSDIEFRYGSVESNSRVNSTRIDEDTYEVYIFEPEESAYLFIFNDRGCGEITQLNLSLGIPAFEYSSVSTSQGGEVLANEVITFNNESTQPYSRWVWNFGDGNIKELPESRDTNDTDGDGISNYQEDQLGFDKNDATSTPPDTDGDGVADGITLTQEETTHEYQISGTYYVTLRIFNSLGCYEDIVKPISVGKGYYVLKPNVFTPFGSDGLNDEFSVLISGFLNYSFSIYDYKGNLVYSETDEEDDPQSPTGLEVFGWDAKGGISNNGSNTLLSTSHNGSPYYVFVLQGTLLKDWDTDPKTVSETGTFILLD